jgi:glucose-1-phosphate thymidylyltransferase
MKALIPAAGVGTRLRPHTLVKPKALLPVAGKPILGHIVDDLQAAGIEEFVLVVGFHGTAVRKWFTKERPHLTVSFCEQSERLGLGHAIWTARRLLGADPFFCVLGDTILKADYSQLLGAGRNVVAVKSVDDPRHFGVAEVQNDRVARFVEKPDQPHSNLALVGAYLFHDSGALWQALERVIGEDIRTKGEYQLTDALQLMIEGDVPFGVVKVRDWFDCGKPETWLQTNRALLEQQDDCPPRDGVTGPCAIGPGVQLSHSRVGPHVAIGPDSIVEDCELSDCVIGARTRLRRCRLLGSLVGDRSLVSGATGQVNVGDFSVLRLDAR